MYLIRYICAMAPVIDSFDGIKICIYNGEHRPPHIHAIFAEHEVLIEIETSVSYAGSLPTKKMKKVNAWLQDNKENALLIFQQLNPQLQ